MEYSSQLYISELGDDEDMEEDDDDEEEMKDDQEDNAEMHIHESAEDIDQDADLESSSWFPCQNCDRHFTSKQGLERHIHIHGVASSKIRSFKCKYCKKSFGSKIGRRRHERRHESRPESLNSVDFTGTLSRTVMLDSNSLPGNSGTPLAADGEQTTTAVEHGELEGGHACKYCEKVFSTHINKRRHERRIHERNLRPKVSEKGLLIQEGNPQRTEAQHEPQPSDCVTSVAIQQGAREQTEQYMLDISSNISENLSFYIDGKIVSTSTVSSCEVVEVNNGSTTLVGLDAVILDPAQISQVLNIESVTGKDLSGQPCSKRRTATPPLLPQIKTELESEVVVSSSSTSLVSSVIENLLPPKTELPIAQKERTVFLSPKLKQLLEKQDGIKPTLAVITDGQKLGTPLSLTVLPAGTGRFKRRTGSPTSSPQPSPTVSLENAKPDLGESNSASAAQLEIQHSPPMQILPNKKESTVGTPPPTEDPVMAKALPETWPTISGGNSCNQQPLDLSNAVKKGEGSLAEAVLDLSLQRKSMDEPDSTSGSVVQPLLKKKKPNTCVLEKVLMNEYVNADVAEKGTSVLPNPDPPLVTDLVVADSEIVTPVEPVTEGLVYGLALPSNTLTPCPSTLTPIALQPASPCTIALSAPVSHSILPTTPSLITVLASPTSIPSPPNQPIQVLAPNITPDPLLICTENPLHTPQCDLTTTLGTGGPANLVTLSQSPDSALNLPHHVILTDQIALNGPVVESGVGSEMPFIPVTLSDSIMNSYNITSNTVLIECTIALDAPGNLVPTAITLQENTVEPPAPSQMVINHIEQQQILSLPNPETVDPTILVSSIAESVTLATTSTVLPDNPTVSEINSGSEPAVATEELITKEETDDNCVFTSDSSTKPPSPSEPPQVKEPSDETATDAQQQTFTKNFICNVCDKLFHSMKELGHHVGEHADEWPYKCEFCLLLFGKPSDLLEHRSNLHGVGKTYICSACMKEFAYLCNLKHHQEELHPGQQCTYTEEEKGKLRPQNHNNSAKVNVEVAAPCDSKEPQNLVKKEEVLDDASEELLTTIKIMASDGGKLKGPDVRLGINQHYPSFKPPPFPYHNRSPAGAMASATNFTTHNIPQTFNTAIRCTKCGKSFDNMPELHKHILACANASDKRRYTPKKNPIPLRHIAKAQNGILSTTTSNGLNHNTSQACRSKSNTEPPTKMKLSALSKRKKKLVHRAMSQRVKAATSSNKVDRSQVDKERESFICPHCNREFTLSRSRTKHMAVCPMKPKEVKKRKDESVSLTKENNGHLRRAALLEEKRQASAQDHKARDRSSSLANGLGIRPAEMTLSKTKMGVKEGSHTKQETLGELPIVRTFNPSMRQYGRVQHGVKEVPLKITIAKMGQSQLQPKNEEQLSNPAREGMPAEDIRIQQNTAPLVKDKLLTVQPAMD